MLILRRQKLEITFAGKHSVTVLMKFSLLRVLRKILIQILEELLSILFTVDLQQMKLNRNKFKEFWMVSPKLFEKKDLTQKVSSKIGIVTIISK